MNFTITITANGRSFIPAVKSGACLITSMRGAPGKLTFTLLYDKNSDVSEGSLVTLSDGEKTIFFGYVFSMEISRDNEIFVTCYDQIRYLKNKDTYIYENKTAAQLIRMIAADFGLKTGEISATNYVIPYRVEENLTLLDMIENALDLTYQNTGEYYVLFDNCGGLCLKSIKEMAVKKRNNFFLLEESSAEDFALGSSIDKSCYNRIKLCKNSKKSGSREIFIQSDPENTKRWGVLQYYQSLKDSENGAAKAKELLTLYNKKSKSLKIKGAFGDSNVRAGSVIAVSMNLPGTKLNRFMAVEKAVHRIDGEEYFMDLTLTDKEFSAV